MEQILEQYPARKISMKKLEDASRAIRRRSHQDTLEAGLQFAEDFMRLRRDRRNYQHVVSWMDRITSGAIGALARAFAREQEPL